VARRFTEVTDKQAAKTLARGFIPLADSLRDLLTRFGLRTYSVKAIKVEWTGRRRGVGAPTIISEELISPTPKLTAFDALQEVIQTAGLEEVGSIELSQISGRYSEEQLRGFTDAGDPLPDNVEFYYEVQFFPHTGPSFRRKFMVRSAPTYFPGRLQWTLRLEKAVDDRQRNGDVEGP
jgi:hypothetical protein